MPTIFVYNPDTYSIERFEKGLAEPMPYITNNTLSVREFRSNSCSNVLWTDKRALQAWNATRQAYGRSIFVGYVFKRIWEGGHSAQSQHYAGVSFDVGQNLTMAGRAELRNLASSLGVWSYVEPAELTPTWVHFDKRTNPPACSAGFPLVREGSRNNYVFILQDALSTLGYAAGGLDGIFGARTKAAVTQFQRDRGLSADGIVGCATWTALTNRVLGIGSTGTTINGC